MTDARSRLYDRLVQVLGDEPATTLMQHLPEPEREHLATKADVGRVETRLDGVDTRLGGVEARLDGVETRLSRVETRLDGVETRLGAVETRLDSMEERFELRFDAVETRLDGIERRLDGMEQRLFDLGRELYTQLLGTVEGVRRDMGEHVVAFQAEVRAQTRMFVVSTIGSAATIAAGLVGAAAVL